jgi:hypothetical protein
MVPSSSAPAVRTYLHDQLTVTLQPDPNSPRSSLLVCYDVPGPNQPDDIVSVGKVHRRLAANSLVGSGGAGWLEERYTVEVIVDVYRGGDDAQATYLRASSLAESVIAVVRSDPTLGGAVVVAKPITDLTEVEWDDQHAGFHACSTLEFECYQRI